LLAPRFGSFSDVLGQDPHLFAGEVFGCGPAVAYDLKIIAAAAKWMTQADLAQA